MEETQPIDPDSLPHAIRNRIVPSSRGQRRARAKPDEASQYWTAPSEATLGLRGPRAPLLRNTAKQEQPYRPSRSPSRSFSSSTSLSSASSRSSLHHPDPSSFVFSSLSSHGPQHADEQTRKNKRKQRNYPTETNEEGGRPTHKLSDQLSRRMVGGLRAPLHVTSPQATNLAEEVVVVPVAQGTSHTREHSREQHKNPEGQLSHINSISKRTVGQTRSLSLTRSHVIYADARDDEMRDTSSRREKGIAYDTKKKKENVELEFTSSVLHSLSRRRSTAQCPVEDEEPAKTSHEDSAMRAQVQQGTHTKTREEEGWHSPSTRSRIEMVGRPHSIPLTPVPSPTTRTSLPSSHDVAPQTTPPLQHAAEVASSPSLSPVERTTLPPSNPLLSSTPQEKHEEAEVSSPVKSSQTRPPNDAEIPTPVIHQDEKKNSTQTSAGGGAPGRSSMLLGATPETGPGVGDGGNGGGGGPPSAGTPSQPLFLMGGSQDGVGSQQPQARHAMLEDMSRMGHLTSCIAETMLFAETLGVQDLPFAEGFTPEDLSDPHNRTFTTSSGTGTGNGVRLSNHTGREVLGGSSPLTPRTHLPVEEEQLPETMDDGCLKPPVTPPLLSSFQVEEGGTRREKATVEAAVAGSLAPKSGSTSFSASSGSPRAMDRTLPPSLAPTATTSVERPPSTASPVVQRTNGWKEETRTTVGQETPTGHSMGTGPLALPARSIPMEALQLLVPNGTPHDPLLSQTQEGLGAPPMPVPSTATTQAPPHRSTRRSCSSSPDSSEKTGEAKHTPKIEATTQKKLLQTPVPLEITEGKWRGRAPQGSSPTQVSPQQIWSHTPHRTLNETEKELEGKEYKRFTTMDSKRRSGREKDPSVAAAAADEKGVVFRTGMRVEARWGSRWFSAVVTEDQRGGYVQIRWKDDDSVIHIKVREVRLPKELDTTPQENGGNNSSSGGLVTPFVRPSAALSPVKQLLLSTVEDDEEEVVAKEYHATTKMPEEASTGSRTQHAKTSKGEPKETKNISKNNLGRRTTRRRKRQRTRSDSVSSRLTALSSSSSRDSQSPQRRGITSRTATPQKRGHLHAKNKKIKRTKEKDQTATTEASLHPLETSLSSHTQPIAADSTAFRETAPPNDGGEERNRNTLNPTGNVQTEVPKVTEAEDEDGRASLPPPQLPMVSAEWWSSRYYFHNTQPIYCYLTEMARVEVEASDELMERLNQFVQPGQRITDPMHREGHSSNGAKEEAPHRPPVTIISSLRSLAQLDDSVTLFFFISSSESKRRTAFMEQHCSALYSCYSSPTSTASPSLATTQLAMVAAHPHRPSTTPGDGALIHTTQESSGRRSCGPLSSFPFSSYPTAAAPAFMAFSSGTASTNTSVTPIPFTGGGGGPSHSPVPPPLASPTLTGSNRVGASSEAGGLNEVTLPPFLLAFCLGVTPLSVQSLRYLDFCRPTPSTDHVPVREVGEGERTSPARHHRTALTFPPQMTRVLGRGGLTTPRLSTNSSTRSSTTRGSKPRESDALLRSPQHKESTTLDRTAGPFHAVPSGMLYCRYQPLPPSLRLLGGEVVAVVNSNFCSTSPSGSERERSRAGVAQEFRADPYFDLVVRLCGGSVQVFSPPETCISGKPEHKEQDNGNEGHGIELHQNRNNNNDTHEVDSSSSATPFAFYYTPPQSCVTVHQSLSETPMLEVEWLQRKLMEHVLYYSQLQYLVDAQTGAASPSDISPDHPTSSPEAVPQRTAVQSLGNSLLDLLELERTLGRPLLPAPPPMAVKQLQRFLDTFMRHGGVNSTWTGGVKSSAITASTGVVRPKEWAPRRDGMPARGQSPPLPPMRSAAAAPLSVSGFTASVPQPELGWHTVVTGEDYYVQVYPRDNLLPPSTLETRPPRKRSRSPEEPALGNTKPTTTAVKNGTQPEVAGSSGPPVTPILRIGRVLQVLPPPEETASCGGDARHAPNEVSASPSGEGVEPRATPPAQVLMALYTIEGCTLQPLPSSTASGGLGVYAQHVVRLSLTERVQVPVAQLMFHIPVFVMDAPSLSHVYVLAP